MTVSKTVSGTGKNLGNVAPDRNLWIAFASAVTGLLLLVSLVDYDFRNVETSPPAGSAPLLGDLGLFLGDHLYELLGIAAWILPWMLGTFSFLWATRSPTKVKVRKIATILVIIVSISVLASVRDYSLTVEERLEYWNPGKYNHGAGGSVGAILYSGMPWLSSPDDCYGGFLRARIGPWGTSVLMGCLLAAGLSIHFSMEPLKFAGKVIGLGKKVSDKIPQRSKNTESSEENDGLKEKKSKTLTDSVQVEDKEKSKPRKTWRFPWFGRDSQDDVLFGDVSLHKDDVSASSSLVEEKKPKQKNKTVNEKDERTEQSELTTEPSVEVAEPIPKAEETKDLSPDPEPEAIAESSDGMEGFKVVREAKTEKAVDLFPERKGDYHFPTPDLLMDAPEVEASGDEDHMIKAKRLKETLSEFKIEVEMGEVHTGPVITRYDVHPAPGVKVEKIANLDKNLAMALKADSVRILAPVPGKGCVGIEVPNANPTDVCLKEILESKAWADAGADIPIVLGKDASGRPLVADLTKMPHLLVAGSTGSGKTVCINAIIASLCYHSSPDDVRFIMVDPKIVEMKVYNDLPHMLIPVVTDPKKVPGALKWLLIEMERRYQIFSKVGVRNIAGFNAKILKDKEEKEKAQLLDAQMTPEERAALSSIEVPRDDNVLEIPENKLPYIVCIIDELADLMMVAQADVETGIARLAQLARAAGIHLVIATQRPSVNVITGVIKANLPSRISFRVASYRDSQTILDGKGAESLLGKGDMLFIPPGGSTFTRAQGAFVSDDEINGIVEFLKINGPPQIIEEVRDQIESAGEEDVLGGGEDSDEDPMIRKAVEIIRTTKRASTSNLQRKLSIGYNRAARIMDELEDRGVVGPDIPGQGREILLDL